MDFQSWFARLNKPSWTPTPSTIGQIWQILQLSVLLFSAAPAASASKNSFPRNKKAGPARRPARIAKA